MTVWRDLFNRAALLRSSAIKQIAPHLFIYGSKTINAGLSSNAAPRLGDYHFKNP